MRFTAKLLLLSALLSVFSQPPAAAVAVSQATITTQAGIALDTSLYLPKKLPASAILLAHGFGGSKDSVAASAKYLAESGW